MNDLTIFNNPMFGEIRTAIINGEPYFCGTDVAKALGYGNPQDSIRRHCKEDGCVNHAVIDSMGRKQEAKFINEGNLYRLMAHSHLDSAERFESWIFDEVLPSIRKTGQYSTNRFEIPLKEQVESLEAVANMLRMNEVSKVEMLESFYGSYNIPTDFLPKYVKAERLTSSLSTLLEKNSCEMKAIPFNKLLIEQGYLEDRERPSSKGGTKKFKSITDKGLRYGENQKCPKNPRETQPLWYEDSFMELYEKVVGR